MSIGYEQSWTTRAKLFCSRCPFSSQPAVSLLYRHSCWGWEFNSWMAYSEAERQNQFSFLRDQIIIGVYSHMVRKRLIENPSQDEEGLRTAAALYVGQEKQKFPIHCSDASSLDGLPSEMLSWLLREVATLVILSLDKFKTISNYLPPSLPVQFVQFSVAGSCV